MDSDEEEFGSVVSSGEDIDVDDDSSVGFGAGGESQDGREGGDVEANNCGQTPM